MAKHADEVPILLHMRRQYVQSASTYPRDLRALDKRIAANLEGLAHAQDAGWDAAVALFEDRPEPATLMAVAFLAYHQPSKSRLDYFRKALRRDTTFIEMAAFGLSWLGPIEVAKIVETLWASGDDIDTATALACALIYDMQPSVQQVETCLTSAKTIRAWAMKVAGWYNMQPLLAQLQAKQHDDDLTCVAARDVALILLSADPIAIQHALTRCEDGFDADFMLLELVLCALDATVGYDWWHRQDDPELRMKVSGLLSDKRCVAWLLQQCENPILADDAIERIQQITGRHIGNIVTEPDLTKAPDPFAVDARKPQSPSDQLRLWWVDEQDSFSEGPLVFGQSLDQAQHGAQDLTITMQRQIALRGRFLVKTATFPIGQAPYLNRFMITDPRA